MYTITLNLLYIFFKTLNSTGHSFDLSKSFKLDNKVKQLKARNSELVAIAKKLEEKAKHVQNEFDEYVSIYIVMKDLTCLVKVISVS